MTARRRLDAELVRRGLAASLDAAQTLIAQRKVLVGGVAADKAARQVQSGDPIELVAPPPPFVSRGGLKLNHALDAFDIAVAHRRALDAGASTGGFTDCLLQRGATEVVALDVGYGQLHERLRADDRVVSRERFHVRDLGPEQFGRFPLLVADLSFISLTKVAGALVSVMERDGSMVLLVKPQFEASRPEVSRGRGIITDPAVWARTVGEVRTAYESLGMSWRGTVESPIRGADGNTEFLAHLVAGTR